jgi:hypothetical protein
MRNTNDPIHNANLAFEMHLSQTYTKEILPLSRVLVHTVAKNIKEYKSSERERERER